LPGPAEVILVDLPPVEAPPVMLVLRDMPPDDLLADTEVHPIGAESSLGRRLADARNQAPCTVVPDQFLEWTDVFWLKGGLGKADDIDRARLVYGGSQYGLHQAGDNPT
jgi:hypothetical protein